MPQVRGGQIKNATIQRQDLDTVTTAQAVITKVVAGTGITLSSTGVDPGTGDVTVNAAASPVALTTVEVSLVTAPDARCGGRFDIAGAGMTVGKPVLIGQANGPYTGKGTREDEAEMDSINVTAKVLSATVIRCYWESIHRVRGNFKFNYFVGA